MTPLGRYMKRVGWTDQTLADLVEKSRPTITKIRTGKAKPSLDLAIHIERLTNRKVPAASFVPELERAA